MVRTKKTSKRMPCRKKYKIERKVREHNRKVRKDTKANGGKKMKKDPGIPNLFPFKEQLLKQMEDRKARIEETKVKQKAQRQKEYAKKRSLQGLTNDAQKRTREFEKKQQAEATDVTSTENSIGVDQSLRAYYREFKKVVEASDVVLEVLDARDPLGCRCVQVEQAVLDSGSNKKLILVLNKIDLVPREVVEKWLKHLRNEFPTVAFKASTQSQKHHLSQKKFPLGTGPSSLMSSSACLGAEVLLKLLGNYCRNADIKTSISVGVVGLPNVGKSSIINSLKRSKTCNVGATPGVTKNLQEIQLDKHVKLIDSPGIVVAAKSMDTASMLLRNCIKVEAIPDPSLPVEAILRRCNRLQVMEFYGIPEFDGVQEFLCHLAKRLGKLLKGGVPDVDSAARSVLRDWNTGRIKFFTHPPEQSSLPSHVSSDIVRSWSAAFDMSALHEEEKQDLSGLQRGVPEMMEINPSQPLTEAFEEEEEEEESELEEDMDSELSEYNDDDSEMEDDEETPNKEMTVELPKRKAKQGTKTPSQPGPSQKDATMDDDSYKFTDFF
ncbi:guanine nucleotide-binding protein-like 3 homolog [Halichondria panicea]|uniref:guanine nucleotide-binding protein-like 3 homolog n=1 Tax=Halichondria panicea TaxID=6063 RepID=UPI00312BA30D